jgi:hypothetical protein
MCGGCGSWNILNNGEDCSCDDPCDVLEDPIAIDLSGAGYLLTNAQNGVKFNFFGEGSVRLSWTLQSSEVGWLVLDRNGNGKIDNGAELFSNVSPQPGPTSAMKGFRALAQYDARPNGGNGDGLITAQDAVFSKLMVWVDKNHDGISQPDELFTMQQAGIKSISIAYTPSRWADVYGNQFRYKGQIQWAKPLKGKTTAAIYDVILVSATKGKGGN